MKIRLPSLPSLILSAVILSGCAGATAYLEKPSTQQAIVDVVNAVASYTGGNSVGAAVDLVQGSTLLLRSNETTPAPTPAALAGAVQTSMQLAKVSPSVTQAVTAAVSTMLANGAAPNDATEAAATTLDAATASPGSSVSRASVRKIIAQHRLKGAQRLVFAADNETPKNMLPEN